MPPIPKLFQNGHTVHPVSAVPPAPPPPSALTPFWTTADGPSPTVELYHGHAVEVLGRLPAGSVHCVTTSPPYWGLRDYSVCGCRIHTQNGTGGSIPGNSGAVAVRPHARPDCPLCDGTGKVKGMESQLGAEPSPDCGTHGQAQCGKCFVCNMVAVFRGVRRVLRDDGTLWLNLGDTYGAPGLASGNLVGVPWRVALALQADGWILRQDVIWHKPCPMPESVRNRCTKAHEYLFLFVKKMGYYYDAEAIKEAATTSTPGEPSYRANGKTRTSPKYTEGLGGNNGLEAGPGVVHQTSNKRSVWTVTPKGYKGAHFATYPPKLIEPCIKAGTSERGCCGRCGAPWERVVESSKLRRSRPNEYTKRQPGEGLGVGNTCANDVAGVDVRTVGWQPGCTCFGRFEEREAVRAVVVRANPPDHEKKQTSSDTRQSSKRSTMYAPGGVPRARGETLEEPTTVRVYVSDLPLDEHPVVPCVVLDPFVGSGTTCAVSLELGRRSVGIDLSEQYLRENALPRVEGKARALGKLELVSEPERRPVDLSQFWANADADTAAETGGDGEAGAAAEAGADYDLDLDGDLGDGGGGYDLQTEEG